MTNFSYIHCVPLFSFKYEMLWIYARYMDMYKEEKEMQHIMSQLKLWFLFLCCFLPSFEEKDQNYFFNHRALPEDHGKYGRYHHVCNQQETKKAQLVVCLCGLPVDSVRYHGLDKLGNKFYHLPISVDTLALLPPYYPWDEDLLSYALRGWSHLTNKMRLWHGWICLCIKVLMYSWVTLFLKKDRFHHCLENERAGRDTW